MNPLVDFLNHSTLPLVGRASVLDRLTGFWMMTAEALNGTAAALRDGLVWKAGDAVRLALGKIRGEAPFPGLYDEYFEQMRERIDVRLHDGSRSVARAFIAERDAGKAEELPREVHRHYSDDEELTEMLADLLVALGKNSEATAITRKQKANA